MDRDAAIRALLQPWDELGSWPPPPEYLHGDVVRTKVGSRGDRIIRTELVARVRGLGFHGVRRQWFFTLDGNSRRRHRWYLAEDLELVSRATEITWS